MRSKIEIKQNGYLTRLRTSPGTESLIKAYQVFAPSWGQAKLYAREVQILDSLRADNPGHDRDIAGEYHFVLAHVLQSSFLRKGETPDKDPKWVYHQRHHLGHASQEEGDGTVVDRLWSLVDQDGQTPSFASNVLKLVKLYKKHSGRSLRECVDHICDRYVRRDEEGKIIKDKRNLAAPPIWSTTIKDMIEKDAFEYARKQREGSAEVEPNKKSSKHRRPKPEVPVQHKFPRSVRSKPVWDPQPITTVSKEAPEPVVIETATAELEDAPLSENKKRPRKKPETQIESDLEESGEKQEIAAIRDSFHLWLDTVLKRVPELDRLTVKRDVQDEFANMVHKLRRVIAHRTRGIDINNRREIVRAFEDLDLAAPRAGDSWDIREAKNRYKRLAMENHPDPNGDQEVYMKITDAYVKIETMHKLHEGRMP